MATQTRVRASTTPRGESRVAKRPQPVAPTKFERLLVFISGLWRGFTSCVASPTRLRREMVGVALVLAALLSSWSLGRGERDGKVIAWWGDALTAAFGRAAPLVPVFIALIAIRAFSSQHGAVLLLRHYAGGFGFAIAALGLIGLGSEYSGALLSGHLGDWIAYLFRVVLGQLGSGLALLAMGFISVFLLAGTDLQTFENDLRDLLPRPKKSRLDDLGEVQVVQAERPQVPLLKPPAFPAALEPATRVINIPDRPVKADGSTVASPLLPVPTGAPPPLPDLSRLAYYDSVSPDTADLHAIARRIEETLTSFKVEARVREINPGPAVTQFALEPGMGIKVRRITELQNDLALALAAPSIRIEAPVPGMARVGLEVPNAQIAKVGLRETLESGVLSRGKAKLPVPLGRDVNGRYIIGDLTRMPHLLIAGATGSGKSVCLNAVISTFLLTRLPDDVKLLMIDPKMVELTGYNGVPHLQCPVVTEMDKVVGALRLVLREMERRYTLFSRLGVRNLDGYRMKIADEPAAERLPYLVVIIDELADLMMTAPEEVETLLVRLAQMARATGIHLIIATQRPSVDVLTGLIKANIPARVAFAVSSGIDSRVVLDMPGAERLLGCGDMLYLPPDAAKPQRIQGAYIEDRDVQGIVDHWHAVAPLPHYSQEWLDLPSGNQDEASGEDDPLREQALAIVRQQGTASASMLQRRLRIGYNRAARLIESMEDEGVIGPSDGVRGRSVLVGGG